MSSDLDLKALFANYIKEALNLIRGQLESKDRLHPAYESHIHWQGNGYSLVGPFFDYQTSFMIEISSSSESFEHLPTFEQLGRRLLADRIVEPPEQKSSTGETIPSNFENLRGWLKHELTRPLAEIAQRYDTFSPTDEQITAILEDFLQEHRDFQAGKVTLTVPLVNFATDVEVVPFGNGLQLCPFHDEDKGRLFETPFHLVQSIGSPVDPQIVVGSKFQLAGVEKTQRPYGSGYPPHLYAEAKRVLTALRLLKRGDVGSVGIFAQRVGRWNRNSDLSSEHSIPFPGHEYRLLVTDVPLLQKTVKCLRDSNAEKELAISLRRFNLAYGRDRGEDVLIDLTISLEGVLLRGLKDELKYRFALRGAALLADLRPPDRTQGVLGLMYDARSAIVHGANPFDNLSKEWKKKLRDLDLDLIVFQQDCKDMTREALQAFVWKMCDNKSAEDVAGELDKRIVSGLRNAKATNL